MTTEYKTPEWKKWSSIYCHRCSKWLANYEGWFPIVPITIKLYCRKCTKEKQQEQKKIEESK